MFKRILIKISGEVFGAANDPFQFSEFQQVAKVLVDFARLNKVKLGIVVGGGNVWRFRDMKESGLDRVLSDKLGMMATIYNAKILESSVNRVGGKAKALSAVPVSEIIDQFDATQAKKYFDDGEIVIFAGGTGNPFFTTDSAAALRALELECDLMIKATKVDGVYSDDPIKNKKAKRYATLSYEQVLAENLGVMDLAAISLCRENKIPVLVFDFTKHENLAKVFKDFSLGTLISN